MKGSVPQGNGIWGAISSERKDNARETNIKDGYFQKENLLAIFTSLEPHVDYWGNQKLELEVTGGSFTAKQHDNKQNTSWHHENLN